MSTKYALLKKAKPHISRALFFRSFVRLLALSLLLLADIIVLMPTQNTQPPAPAPPVESGQNSTGPAGQFDFMLKDQPRPPSRFGSLLSGIPRPVKVVLAALGILFALVILYTLLFGGKATNTDPLTSVMASAQEISRVSTLAHQQAKDADTKDLATTTAAILSSQEQELRSYLKSKKVKVDTKKLAAKLDKKTDAQLATALQNNNYDQAYFNYLKTSLASYQNTLSAANKGVSLKVQAILKVDYSSVQTLLVAPQLK